MMKLNLSWNAKRTLGTVIGILTPIICIPLVIAVLAWTQNFYFVQLWNGFKTDEMIQSKFFSLAIIPNLGWFYLFLNKERYDIARGIIVGSALYLPYILYLNYN